MMCSTLTAGVWTKDDEIWDECDCIQKRKAKSEERKVVDRGKLSFLFLVELQLSVSLARFTLTKFNLEIVGLI
jgi:hypothetical protein